MKTRNTKKRLTLLLVTFLVAALAVACGRRNHEPLSESEIEDRAMDGTEDVIEDLDGSEAQVADAQKIVRSYLPTVYEVRKLREPTRASLRAELLRDTPDADKMATIADDLGAELTKAAHGAADKARELHAVLNAEQRAELAERWKNRPERRAPDWVVDAVFKRFLDEIDATDEQYEFALAKKAEWTVAVEKLRAESKNTRSTFIAALEADAPNMSRVHGEIDAMSARLRALSKTGLSDVAAFAATLSDDQRARIAEMTEKR